MALTTCKAAVKKIMKGRMALISGALKDDKQAQKLLNGVMAAAGYYAKRAPRIRATLQRLDILFQDQKGAPRSENGDLQQFASVLKGLERIAYYSLLDAICACNEYLFEHYGISAHIPISDTPNSRIDLRVWSEGTVLKFRRQELQLRRKRLSLPELREEFPGSFLGKSGTHGFDVKH